MEGATKRQLVWTVGLGAVLWVCLMPGLTTLAGSSDYLDSRAQRNNPAEQGLSIDVTCTKNDLPEDLRSNTDFGFEIRSCPNSDDLCPSGGSVIASLSPSIKITILEKSPYDRGWLEEGTFPDNITLHLISTHDSISDCLRCYRTVDVTFSPRFMNVSTLCFQDLTALTGWVSSGPLSVRGVTTSTSAQMKMLLSAVEKLPADLFSGLKELLTCGESEYGRATFIVLIFNLLVQFALCFIVLFILSQAMKLVRKYLPPLDAQVENEGEYGDVNMHADNLIIRNR